MKAKVKKGSELLFTSGCSNDWSNLKDCIIINFNDRWIYKSFTQNNNHLHIDTEKGVIDIVFSSDLILEYDHYEKDQLVLNIKK